jgi:hypothetical protein
MDAQQFEIQLSEAETELDRLKALYEQWFQGFERLEPTILRKNLDRRLDAMRREMPHNIGLRFRYQQMVQRYTSYTVYWRRIARQIEEGTYNRDILRARRRRIGSINSSAPPVARAATPVDERASSAGPSDISPDRIRQLYDRFVEARLKNNERADNIKLESVEKSVRDMLPKLRQKYGDRPIDFEVVIKDGRVGIKPVVS